MPPPMLSSQSILHITVPHTGLYEHATSSSNFEASESGSGTRIGGYCIESREVRDPRPDMRKIRRLPDRLYSRTHGYMCVCRRSVPEGKLLGVAL